MPVIFRSNSAPASLKPYRQRHPCQYPCHFPEQFRSGLIEARRKTVLFLPRLFIFRSNSAPASLKLCRIFASVSWGEYIFRSNSAPASLKRSGGTWVCSGSSHFPEQFRSGLIEASQPVRGPRPCRDFLEHFCSGLIEACSGSRRGSPDQGFSGAIPLRPH